MWTFPYVSSSSQSDCQSSIIFSRRLISGRRSEPKPILGLYQIPQFLLPICPPPRFRRSP
ncbi:hypothetical protein AVEN_87296-1, partial [Araneus ventricosus]